MIYETRGRAREYFELAANLYDGCEHGCQYCYGAGVLHKDPTEYFKPAKPRLRSKLDGLFALATDANRLAAKGEKRHVLLSFVTDPYQPAEDEYQLTRRAIQILHKAGLPVAILTKGAERAMLDFELLTKGDCFGVTLTFSDRERSRLWEPRADLPDERILALEEAHDLGIQTWVSCEPVIDPSETLGLIETTAPFVDVFKVGTLNYPDKLPGELRRQVRNISWQEFARNAVKLLDRLGANYYIKRDLGKYIGMPDGVTVGNVPK